MARILTYLTRCQGHGSTIRTARVFLHRQLRRKRYPPCQPATPKSRHPRPGPRMCEAVSQTRHSFFLLVILLTDIFVVVNGVPSVGTQIMCGSGQIEQQPILAVATIPSPSLPASSGNGTSTTSTTKSGKNGANYMVAFNSWSASVALLAVLASSISGWH